MKTNVDYCDIIPGVPVVALHWSNCSFKIWNMTLPPKLFSSTWLPNVVDFLSSLNFHYGTDIYTNIKRCTNYTVSESVNTFATVKKKTLEDAATNTSAHSTNASFTSQPFVFDLCNSSLQMNSQEHDDIFAITLKRDCGSYWKEL
ncbi:hypothetical protein CHUAL_012329 [Chamberlinius hualienensis]